MPLDGALRAARRGVRVRLPVDEVNVGDRESDLALLDGHAKVQVRLFNPLAQRGGICIGCASTTVARSRRRKVSGCGISGPANRTA
ncbi:MAG: hypothetical protein IH627_18485 [Rubrivivax sp.]|nr:hypothetical protein [Rubrivivax sp.]